MPNYVEGRNLLAGRTVLVTAAAGTGIGSAAALRAAEEGATAVMLSDLHEGRLVKTAEHIAEKTGLQPATCLCDVTREEQVQALVKAAVEAMGGIDILVNNAGLGGSAPVVDMTDEQWHKVLDVTLTGTFRMTRAVLRHMRERRRGVIVNNASVLGWRAQQEQAHYAAAKAGVMALTRCSALEAAEFGVRINAVAPSIAMHPFLNRAADDAVLKDLISQEAFGRAAETWEIANVMMFLASDYSSYMTGEVVSVSNRHP